MERKVVNASAVGKVWVGNSRVLELGLGLGGIFKGEKVEGGKCLW